MKTGIKVITGLVMAAMLFTGTGSGSQAANVPSATKSISIKAGGKKTIKVTGKYIKSKAFKSTNTKIATVSKKGVVTAKKKGSCSVKVTVKYRKTKKAKAVKKKVLVTKVTVKAAANKTPTPTEAPDDDETDETDDTDEVKKNAKDVAALQKIIQTQSASGASVDDDLDSSQYTWSDEGRLEGIDWELCDLSGAVSFAPFTALKELSCGDNQLIALIVNGCYELTALSCQNNQIKILDVSKNTALTELYCYGNQVTKLNLSKNAALTYLYCDGKVDVTGVSEECTVDYNNDKNEQDVKVLNSIINTQTALGAKVSNDLDSNQYTWTERGRLQGINWDSCALSGNLSVSAFTELEELNCGDNQLTALTVSGCTKLITLSCYGNQLKSLDVSKNIALTNLSCHENKLSSLSVSKNKVLESISCDEKVRVSGASADCYIDYVPAEES